MIRLETLLGYQMRRASAAMMADLSASLAEIDLTPTQMSVLFKIAELQGGTQSEIARMLGLQRANMAPIASQLGERGLVVRAALDGRSQELALTEAGEALVAAAEARVIAHEARFLKAVKGADRDRLVALLRSVWSD
jgi:DNA-binding MarR family transcriptional regulator